MTIEDFILSQCQELAHPLEVEQGNLPLEDAVFKRVMSKKFRKVQARLLVSTTSRLALGWRQFSSG